MEASKYKKCESVVYPPFTSLSTRMKKDPSFNYSCFDGEKPFENYPRHSRNTVVAARTTETLSLPSNVSIEETV